MGEDHLGLFCCLQTQSPDQDFDVVEVLKLFSETHGETLHREEILRMRGINADVESSTGAEKAFNGIVQPVFGKSLAQCDGVSRLAQLRLGNQQSVDVF